MLTCWLSLSSGSYSSFSVSLALWHRRTQSPPGIVSFGSSRSPRSAFIISSYLLKVCSFQVVNARAFYRDICAPHVTQHLDMTPGRTLIRGLSPCPESLLTSALKQLAFL